MDQKFPTGYKSLIMATSWWATSNSEDSM